MAFQKVGIELSKTRDFAQPLGFAIPDGDFGRNSIPAESLEPETEYFVRAYFDYNGMRTWSENIGRFWTLTPPKGLTFNAGSNGGTVQLKKSGSPSNITLDYTTDGGSTWTTWSSANGNLAISLSAGGAATLKGDNNTFSVGNGDYYHFELSGVDLVEGNVMSLVDSTIESTTIPCAYCFISLFAAVYNCDFDVELPATTLTNRCYNGMFNGCNGMTHTPELPATALADYCYQGMFTGTSITQAPALPATTLASGCYESMFQGCTALRHAPELPATTLSGICYSRMFSGCTSLETAPDLPAEHISTNSYSEMFKGCTSLVESGLISGVPWGWYALDYMFQGCSSLNKVYFSGTAWNTYYANSWMDGVAANGDFYNLGGATIPTGSNGIPSGWTVHTSL